MLALDLIGVIPVIGALKYSDEIGTLFKNADKVSVVARSTDGTGVLVKQYDLLCVQLRVSKTECNKIRY